MLYAAGIYIFISYFLSVHCDVDKILLPDYSLVKPFLAPISGFQNWRFTGTAFLNEQYLSLTSDEQKQVGGMWSLSAVHFPAWEIEIQFRVYGSKKDWYGDGFAVWYVKQADLPGKAFGYKEDFTGLGIFLDTYNNHNGPHNHLHPYVSAMVNNGSSVYDHDTDGTLTQLAGCEFFFRSETDTAFVIIRYVNSTLSVYRGMGTESPRVCFETDAVELPTGYYFGITAATGDLSDNHQIFSFKTYEILTDQIEDRSNIIPRAGHAESPRARVEDSPRFLRRFLKAFVIFSLVVIFLGLIGKFLYSTYTAHKLRSKRFY